MAIACDFALAFALCALVERFVDRRRGTLTMLAYRNPGDQGEQIGAEEPVAAHALRRGGELRGEGCVAIKRFKPKQDERVDLPSIGLQTVRLLIEQHYRCLAVDAGKTLFFDRAEALALADKHNFCIVALTEDSFGKLRLQAKAD